MENRAGDGSPRSATGADVPIDVLVFGPGLPATGLRGSLRIEASQVEVDWPEAPARLRAPLERLAFREIGFGKPGLELRWSATSGVFAALGEAPAREEWLVHVLDPVCAARLRGHPEWSVLPAMQSLQRSQRRGRAGRLLGGSLIALLALSPLLLVLWLFSQTGNLAEAIADRIPLEQEQALGRQAFESMRGTLRLLPDSPMHRVVVSLGQRLSQGSRYRYQFHLADDPALNAFALPGGIIVVNRGLIEATRRPEELAGVLAHEIEHVELRHGTAGLVRELGWRALWTWVSGDWGGTLAGQAAAELGSLKFSRDAESAADEAGFNRLVAAGIDPSGMADFFAILARKSADSPPAFLSTHPASEAREERLRERVGALAGRRFPPLELGTWQP